VAVEAGHAPNRAYFDQQGNLHYNNSQVYDSGEVAIGQAVNITAAAGAANVSLVTYQVVDGSNAAIAVVKEMQVWLSDNTNGIGLTATTSSGAVAAGASGTDLGTLTTKKALAVITDATGKYILSVTDNAKTNFCPACSIGGKIAVGSRLSNASYG